MKASLSILFCVFHSSERMMWWGVNGRQPERTFACVLDVVPCSGRNEYGITFTHTLLTVQIVWAVSCHDHSISFFNTDEVLHRYRGKAECSLRSFANDSRSRVPYDSTYSALPFPEYLLPVSPAASHAPPAVSTLRVFRRELHIASKYGCVSEPKASSHRSIYE